MRDNEELRKRFGDDIPDVAKIAKKISLTFVNQHYSYAGPKPLSNQLIEIGGLHIKPEKPIPQVSSCVFPIFHYKKIAFDKYFPIAELERDH